MRLAAVCGVAYRSRSPDVDPAANPSPGPTTRSRPERPRLLPRRLQGCDRRVEERGGALTIYSNTDQENWEPIFRDFKKKYPWVEKIDANNLDSDEVFQRVLSEQATSGSPAISWCPTLRRPGPTSPDDRERCWSTSHRKWPLPPLATLMPNVLDVGRSHVHRVQHVAGDRQGDGSEEPGRHRGQGSGQVHRQDHHARCRRRLRFHRVACLCARRGPIRGPPGKAVAAG